MKRLFRMGLPTLLLTTVATVAQAAEPAPSAQDRAPKQLYNITCGYCHGRNVGPILLGRQLPAEYIRTMVRSGPNGMPAFRPTEISNTELDALASWISASDAAAAEYGQ